jgi:hypothetical protein
MTVERRERGHHDVEMIETKDFLFEGGKASFLAPRGKFQEL